MLKYRYWRWILVDMTHENVVINQADPIFHIRLLYAVSSNYFASFYCVSLKIFHINYILTLSQNLYVTRISLTTELMRCDMVYHNVLFEIVYSKLILSFILAVKYQYRRG